MEVADVWDGGISSPVSPWRGLKVRVVNRFKQVPRRILGTIFTTLGTYVFLFGLLHSNELKHFQVNLPVREKVIYNTVYKDVPVPPEPGFDTGNVIIKYQWGTTDRKGTTPTGEYQVETPDGVVSIWKFCSNPIPPSMEKGEKLNIHVITDQEDLGSKQPCTKFVRARRWK